MAFEGRRVLVVDDEFLVALTTSDFLEQLGCEIVGPAASPDVVAGPFAATPCLENPLEQSCLVRHLGAIWETPAPALRRA